LFLYNQANNGEKKGVFRECASERTVNLVREGLVKTGYHILSHDLFCPQRLDNFIAENAPIDFSFVLAEGYKDHPQTLYGGYGAAMVREQLRKHNIPTSHSKVESMEICRNKDFTHQRLTEHGVLVPKHLVVDTGKAFSEKQLLEGANSIGYPLIVKPAGGGGSIGISPQSIVHSDSQLKSQIANLEGSLGSGKLVIEQFLPGQEFTLAVMGSSIKYIPSIIAFPQDWGIRHADTKSIEHQMQDRLIIIDRKHSLFSPLADISLKSFLAVGASDIIRLDIKADQEGNLYVIDINGTPSLSMFSSVTFMAHQAPLSHSELIKILLYESLLRNNLSPIESLAELVAPIKEKLSPYVVTRD
jgi:D-alanine-D-alanine ligase